LTIFGHFDYYCPDLIKRNTVKFRGGPAAVSGDFWLFSERPKRGFWFFWSLGKFLWEGYGQKVNPQARRPIKLPVNTLEKSYSRQYVFRNNAGLRPGVHGKDPFYR
jgi:hypothetical protein